ncbi:LacI family DNA-binding transcriptional regulator [Pseudarthrobacter cellobiosi]|uniref:LacI family DNA-binding transcriptional regulator n=1 Tax=Pseudarthrobacter cellobiosi TaxID=2953654 RepID=UPI00208E0A4B|nr:LacI family DNA-binding transcriptional regulator [Pseudarthrobacter sp. HLT1-5]MCO4255286.1 LacI family transcriptional regulator [Pseudarthrobacter sp. HLT1-5]
MAVTMNDVARVAGVSLKTVSNVLNDYEFIRPATRQRVQDAIAELGDEANLAARSLRSGKTHLLARGRRRIAVLGARPGESTGSAGLRLNGYRSALEDAGVPFDPALVAPGEWRGEGGAAAVASLLESGVPFDAVFGLNDALALGAMHELLVRGVKVPQDVAVAGFDDIDEARFASPSLTTVSPGMGEIAERSVGLLVDRIEGLEARAEGVHAEAGFDLKIRDSAP